MKTFEIIIDVIVILSLVYVSFVLTLADWLAALRKGQAISLLPERNGRTYPFWVQVGLVVLLQVGPPSQRSRGAYTRSLPRTAMHGEARASAGFTSSARAPRCWRALA